MFGTQTRMRENSNLTAVSNVVSQMMHLVKKSTWHASPNVCVCFSLFHTWSTGPEHQYVLQQQMDVSVHNCMFGKQTLACQSDRVFVNTTVFLRRLMSPGWLCASLNVNQNRVCEVNMSVLFPAVLRVWNLLVSFLSGHHDLWPFSTSFSRSHQPLCDPYATHSWLRGQIATLRVYLFRMNLNVK